jgi:RimJ/RimL family protein N-acetyltransferase
LFSTVPAVICPRLDLVSMSPEFMTLSLSGELDAASRLIGAELPNGWPGTAARTLRLRLRQLAVDPAVQPWLLRAMVLRDPSRVVVGRIGFHAEPDPSGAVEIGYAVELAFRRRGFAEEAVRGMLDWALHEHGISLFIASVSPSNAASLALVSKFGFVQIGSQWDDEDGEELVFELRR